MIESWALYSCGGLGDGFIADAEDNVGPLFEWYFNGDAEIVDGGPFKVSKESVGTCARCGNA